MALIERETNFNKANFDDEQELYWLASFPKSGNTWLRSLITSYYLRLTYYDINLGLDVTSADTSPLHYQTAAIMDIKYLSQNDVLLLRSTAILNEVFASKMKKVFLKTHNVNRVVNNIRMVPQMERNRGAILLVRDPRDMILSWCNHFETTIDEVLESFKNGQVFLSDVHNVTAYPLGWDIFYESWEETNDMPICTVRYEDLLTDTETQFKRILETLNFEIEQERLENAINACTFDKFEKQEKEHGFREYKRRENLKFFNKGKSGNWNGKFSEEQNQKIIDMYGKTMQKYGYI